MLLKLIQKQKTLDNTSPKAKARFPLPESVGERQWGEEILLVLSEGKYTMKKLIINKGVSGGLQFHRKKDESGYIISGTLLVTYQDLNGKLTKKELKKGDWFHFPSGCIHQETAITKVELIEVSTPHFNDRVRVEKQFGLSEKDNFGLPTTQSDEIITK